MSKYWSKTTASLTPYVPGEQPKDRNIIKLNTNENPYPPSEAVLQALRSAADDSLRLYPDPHGSRLIQAIAETYDVSVDEIFVGNGSDEILAFAFQAFFDPDQPVLFPDVTYSFYTVYADLFHLPYTAVPLDEHFHIVPESFFIPNGGMIVPNPNAPTAIHLPLSEVRKLLDKNTERVVILDEAYIDFGGESAIPLIYEYPNLLVVQTLSKSRSLAGLRVGYAIGQPELIEGLNRIKNSFNSYTLDRLALAGAEASFADKTHIEKNIERIVRTRDWTTIQLSELGFQLTPSRANFLFVSHSIVPAQRIFQKLREHGILVRYWPKARIDNHLRITIGTDDEMQKLIEALEIILKEG